MQWNGWTEELEDRGAAAGHTARERSKGALGEEGAARHRTTGGVIVIGIIGKISPDSVDKPHGWLDGSHR